MAKVPLMVTLKRRTRIFYGWWIVIFTTLQAAIEGGTFNEGFVFYFLPISRDLNLSRTAMSFAIGMKQLTGVVQGPVGHLIDRIGAREVIFAGGFLAGLGFVMLHFTHSYLGFLLVFTGLISLGFKGFFSLPAMTVVNSWFIRRRGLAMSIVFTGSAAGGVVIAPLVGVAVFNLGWRTSALISGIVVWLVVLPLALLLRPSPESMGLLPDGDRADQPDLSTEAHGTSVSHASPIGVDFSAQEALRTPSFWLLTLAQCLRNAGHVAIIVHLVPIMVWSGLEETATPFFVGLLFFSIMALRPFAGWLGDLWSKEKLTGIGLILGALALVVLMRSGGQWWMIVAFLMLLGCAEAMNAISWAIMGDFFGRKSFATLRGWAGMAHNVAAVGTPIYAGWVFDQTQSYTWALIPLAGVYLFGGIVFWALRPPKPPVGPEEPRPQNTERPNHDRPAP